METFKKVVKENYKHGLLMITYLILIMIYNLLNQRMGKIHDLVTSFDRSTPFVKEFIIPYDIWYPFILFCMLYLLVKHKDSYYRAIIGLDIGLIICYICYIFYQTTVPRPELMGNDIFTKIVRITYKSDSPFNCFPSIHVFTTSTMIIAMVSNKKISATMKIAISTIGITIIASTLFVKQHVMLDIIGGSALSVVTSFMVRRIEAEKFVAWIKKIHSEWTIKKKLQV